ncbi:MAG: prepilin-type N-terminal cleavage/methylation domain-containing protein, partial [Parabacteroides sp.]|nr:prepilin-type N-terminal cleavage/methylation domain-containing protein [Parabacteroides sp.]
MNLPNKRHAFTLVELIVVIAVLSVLATVSFATVSNVSVSARNSARVTDVSTIASKLETWLSLGKPLPKPENGVDLIASGSVVGYQGNFGTNSARTLGLSEIKDPKDGAYYTYVADSKLKSYQLLGFKENTAAFILGQIGYADSKTPFTKGDTLGTLYDTIAQTPIEKMYPNSQIDLLQTSSGLTALFSDTKQLSGTGFAFGGSMWSLLAKQSNFDAPKSCPAGFIPVPGNVEFLQPGFCVMKYEAKALGGTAGPSADGITYKTHDYQLSDTVVSNAKDMVIATISQTQAVAACRAMGSEYHLISNNEWMTLARNAEAQGGNWSSGMVGSGYMYSGHNDQSPATILTASTDDSLGYANTNDTATT